MSNVDEQKENLARQLSEQYSQNIITIEEYERILEYINKIETRHETRIIGKIIQENNDAVREPAITKPAAAVAPDNIETHLSVFSERASNISPVNGNGGKHVSVFGTSQITADNLPEGRTTIQVEVIFGSITIIVSKNAKIINEAIPIFSSIAMPNETNSEYAGLPELRITGRAVFGEIAIRRAK
ncbi:MAG: hypothetical protein LBD48_00665 [Treponema sp.]|jgi:predicted transcriptional regulator|nr:hypothetical protein [Treponema sp.]